MTPVTVSRETTHPAPLSAPGVRRAEDWAAASVDGRWRYERLEEDGTPWQVVFVPSGQVGPDWYGTLGDAREATAGDLAGRLFGAAVAWAFDPAAGGGLTGEEVDGRRRAGHRWLAGHLQARGAGADGACWDCGVAVTTALPDGRWAHVHTGVLGELPECCPAPGPAVQPVGLTDFERRVLRFMRRHRMGSVVPVRAGTLATEIRAEFELPEARFFQRLNLLLDRPAARAAEPLLVGLLLRDRERRWQGPSGC